MRRRVKSGLTVLAYFTAVGLMFFAYRYLEYVANRGGQRMVDLRRRSDARPGIHPDRKREP